MDCQNFPLSSPTRSRTVHDLSFCFKPKKNMYVCISPSTSCWDHPKHFGRSTMFTHRGQFKSGQLVIKVYRVWVSSCKRKIVLATQFGTPKSTFSRLFFTSHLRAEGGKHLPHRILRPVSSVSEYAVSHITPLWRRVYNSHPCAEVKRLTGFNQWYTLVSLCTKLVYV